MIALDSSVLVAALAGTHDSNRRAAEALAGASALVGHTAFETCSVMSRLPEGYRFAPEITLAALEQAFPKPWLALDGEGVRACLRAAVAAGLRGGGVYDALIGATAVAHGATLVSTDRRAQAAYEAVGAAVQYIDA